MIAAELVPGHEAFVTTPNKSLDTVGELLPERRCECSVEQIRHFGENMRRCNCISKAPNNLACNRICVYIVLISPSTAFDCCITNTSYEKQRQDVGINDDSVFIGRQRRSLGRWKVTDLHRHNLSI